MREYICGWCLETVVLGEGAEYPIPEYCPYCRMGNCQKCGTRVKPISVLCQGCGTLKPPMQARLIRADSISVVYAQENWLTDGLGLGMTERFGIANGCLPNNPKCTSVWLYKGDSGNVIHEFTDEERTLLGYRTRAEIAAWERERNKEALGYDKEGNT